MPYYRSKESPQVFYKKGFLKNFGKLTGKSFIVLFALKECNNCNQITLYPTFQNAILQKQGVTTGVL